MFRIRYGDIAAVFAGGAVGGVARYGVSLWLGDADTMLGTTAVNLSGSFLLAFITYGLAMYFDLPEWLILALGTGFIGAFTTFSTLVLNLFKYIAAEPAVAVSMFVLNLVGGLVAAFLGFLLAEWTGRRWYEW